MTSAISLQNVQKIYRTNPHTEITAVAGVTLDIQPGEIVALLGANGAGKTTLLDMILGLTDPTAGAVSVAGMTPRTAVQQSRINAVLQTGGLLPDLTLRSQVAMVAALYSTHCNPDTVLQRVGLTEIAGRKIRKCSGGQQQKVKLALALLGDPDILVLDEPTTGLDVTARAAFWETMREQAASGKTILFATHYLEEAQEFASRIVMLEAGHIIADGSPEQVTRSRGVRRVSFRSATLPVALQTSAATKFGVTDLTVTGDTVCFSCTNVESCLKAVLADSVITDLTVQRPSLAEIFTTAADTAAVQTV